MNNKKIFTSVAVLLAIAPANWAADFKVNLDARDIRSKRVHTQLTIPVRPGALTLVYPKWLPGEHGPTGPLESVIGLEIRANGQALSWARDPLDMYAIRITVPAGAAKLDIHMETGLAVGGDGFSSAPTSSDQLAILPWNEFLLFPKGIDAKKVMIDASVQPPVDWALSSALENKATGGVHSFETASIARLIDSPVQIGHYSHVFALQGSAPAPELKHVLSVFADS